MHARLHTPTRTQHTQAFEILELYLELLSVRGPLVASTREIPRDMIEALSSVLYAASRWVGTLLHAVCVLLPRRARFPVT